MADFPGFQKTPIQTLHDDIIAHNGFFKVTKKETPSDEPKDQHAVSKTKIDWVKCERCLCDFHRSATVTAENNGKLLVMCRECIWRDFY